MFYSCETTSTSVVLVAESEIRDENKKEERSLMYEEGPKGNTKEIVDRIKAINDAISTKKPTKRPQMNWNTQPQTGGGYIMDKDVLEKLQQIIASGKLHSYPDSLKPQEHNLAYDNYDLRHSRQIAPMIQGNQGMPIMPVPYMTNIPVLVMPQVNMNGYNNMLSPQQFGPMTRQGPEPPTSIFGNFGSFQWPFASWFPILIKDPIVSMIQGGGWSNFIQTGQEADVCRRLKSAENEKNVIQHDVITNANEIDNNIFQDQVSFNMRQGRAIKKRTVSHETRIQEVDDKNKSKKVFKTKPITSRKPVKQVHVEQDTKTVNSDNGDLRFPFGEFSFFGNKKPVAPSPGFFINRMKVRRGGVAIAGPGGVATAGRGGTAIVGPGGLAYTQPGGLAVAGPHARVIALSQDADLHSVISRLQEQNGSVTRSLQAIPEGKVVATGPVIYYHPNP
ncbi:Uncharacterized protein OBRU01_18041 [Operophtera brumata]|uniref:DUF4774 domain-containing protein n=1 Tax=Operophtera brumata TaxID=104452 RepID=A0A0L7KZY4_OPEBR|nr:Uncharacterized protein OBRU01_18041 [Operophtera brumata]